METSGLKGGVGGGKEAILMVKVGIAISVEVEAGVDVEDTGCSGDNALGFY